MMKDCGKFARECKKCHMFAPIHHVPSNELTFVASLWSFIEWKIDIVGLLPEAPG